MIAFAIDTGLRLEERLSLTLAQIDLRRDEVFIEGTKTGKARSYKRAFVAETSVDKPDNSARIP